MSQVNRATGETMRQQATQEGLVPLKAWVKNALDHVIRECMNEPGLEFVWVGDDAVDPLEQAQTLQILVGAGIKTREEARADLGLDIVARHLTGTAASGRSHDQRTSTGAEDAGYRIAVDGDYGTETRQVITDFQMRAGIVADGGAQTEAKLLSDLNRMRETDGHLPR